MNIRVFASCIFLLSISAISAQSSSSNLATISIEKDNNFDGFEMLSLENQKLFVLAEHWHYIRSVPKATMKILRYLHQQGNVRILAIEQGQSVAHLINQFLSTGDTLVLRKITRNSMFWGKENYAFFQDLREFNMTLSDDEHIVVQSIDIEYKMEPAILVINELIGDKSIPTSLEPTLGRFQQMFEESQEHREQFDVLAVLHYYDKKITTQLVEYTLYELRNDSSRYIEFFGSNYDQFYTMIEDMFHGLIFDYTNPNSKYRFRDRLIYGKITELVNNNPNNAILCVIGMRHATKRSSISKLNTNSSSPLLSKVLKIRISAMHNKSILSGDLHRINFTFPNQLKTQKATMIKHDSNDPTFKSKKGFHYTMFINNDGNLTPYTNAYKVED